MADRWQIDIDARLCKRSGICVGTAPNFFEFGPNSAVPISAEVTENDDVLDAAACCPTEAITIRHAETLAVIDPVG